MTPRKAATAKTSPRSVKVPLPGTDDMATANLRLVGHTARHRLAAVGHDRRGNGSSEQPRLYERQAFLNEFAAMFSGAWPHPNGAVVIEGFHSTGRTALLGAACRLAREKRISVIRACGSHLERGTPWGAVRQLFGDTWGGTTSNDPQGGAMTANLGPSGNGTSGDPELAKIYDDLDARLDEMAVASPVLVAVDDADLVDELSAGWLSHLARHLERRDGAWSSPWPTAGAAHR